MKAEIDRQFISTEDIMEGILGMVFFFTCTTGILGSLIYTRHKERMTMMEKGLKPEDMKGGFARSVITSHPLSSLKWGILLLSVGLGILISSRLHYLYVFDDGVYPGVIALFGGIGLVIYYLIARKRVPD
jgi:hypothetical protein